MSLCFQAGHISHLFWLLSWLFESYKRTFIRASPTAAPNKRLRRALQRRRKNRARDKSGSARGAKRHRAPLISSARSRALHTRAPAPRLPPTASRRSCRRPHHPICSSDPTALPRPIPAPPLLPPPPSSRRRPSRAPFLRRTAPGRALPLGAHMVFDKTLAR